MHRPHAPRMFLAAAIAAATLTATSSPAHAAVAQVPNGITVTDMTTPSVTASALAGALVGANPGITITNAAYTGTQTQLGTFTALDPAVLSFNSGVIMSSGDVSNIVGPNKSESITGVETGVADSDLTSLISESQTVVPMTYDAATLEFDFTPTTSPVYFTYVFGSDEYLEWVNLFDDVFGFFVTDHAGTKTNCAVTPQAPVSDANPLVGAPVSIDTINSTVNSTLYRDNSAMNPPTNPLNVEADGLSVELICTANVTPNQSNHMKLAIADTSDQVLDSWVMLKGGSLSTTKPESCNDGMDDDNDTLIDMADTDCTSTTTAAPVGASGVGADQSVPPFTGSAGEPVTLDASIFGVTPTSIDAVEPPTTFQWTVTPLHAPGGTCVVSPDTAEPAVDGQIPPADVVCTVAGEYTARLDAFLGTDNKGDWDVDFFIQNAPPEVSITSPAMFSAYATGATVSVVAPITGLTLGETAACTINWGDGTSSVSGSVTDGVCSGSKVLTGSQNYLVSVTATDGVVKASALSLISVGLTAQSISVTTEPPVTARFHSSFTVVATGGGSEQALTFGSSGGCTNVDGTFTMTSSTESCFVTVDQAGNATYSAAPQQSYEVVADLGQQTRIALKSKVVKGKYLKVPKATVEGGAITVKVTGACTLTKVYKGSGSMKKLSYFKVTGKKVGQKCKVKISAASVANYESLPSYTTSIKVIKP